MMLPAHLKHTQPSVSVGSQELRPDTQQVSVTQEDNAGHDWEQLGGNGQTVGYVDKKSLNI